MEQHFSTTRWSIVVSAGAGAPASRSALNALCRQYWGPVYLFLRHKMANDAEAALDLTQQLFSDLIERNDFARVRPEHGKFRSWVLACAKHALANERNYRRAQKRDERKLDWIDAARAEFWSKPELMDFRDPERAFEYGFTCALLQRALERLRERYAARGNAALFDEVHHLMVHPRGGGADYEHHAEVLGIKGSTLKVQVHRMRERFSALVRAEIGELVEHPALIEDELKRMEASLSPDAAS